VGGTVAHSNRYCHILMTVTKHVSDTSNILKVIGYPVYEKERPWQFKLKRVKFAYAEYSAEIILFVHFNCSS
jgi:hypothetical protein